MAIDAPVILSALFFTVIAIIVASVFLARKSGQNKPKPNQEETRPEEAAEYYRPEAEIDASPPVVEGKVKEYKVVDAEDKKEDPVSVPGAVEEIGIADDPAVVEAEVTPVQEAQIQAAAVPEVASGKESIHDPTPVDAFTSEPVIEPLEVPASEPVPEQMPVDTVPEVIPESVPEQVLEPPVPEHDHEPVQEPEVDSELASGLFLEPAPEPLSEPSSEPVSESSSETLSELIPVQVLEAIAEQVSKAIAEQVSEAISEQVSEPSAEQISEAVLEPTFKAPPEPAAEVVPEVAEHSETAATQMEAEWETPSFKHGKKRTTEFEKAMTKEELEEEQRAAE